MPKFWGDIMKRFFIDAVFVFLLIAIGSTLQDPASSQKASENITKQVEEFEENVALHKKIEAPRDTPRLNEIEENKASQMAKDTSDFVIDVIDTSVNIVSEIFHGITD